MGGVWEVGRGEKLTGHGGGSFLGEGGRGRVDKKDRVV